MIKVQYAASHGSFYRADHCSVEEDVLGDGGAGDVVEVVGEVGGVVMTYYL